MLQGERFACAPASGVAKTTAGAEPPARHHAEDDVEQITMTERNRFC